MITITDKTKCSGCYACYNCCPKDCITMVEDEEGFRYPQVDKAECINCGLCEKICPMLGGAENIRAQRKGIKSVACYDNNRDVLAVSASGGICNILSEYVIEKGGAVFGVAGNAITKVEHLMVETKEELPLLQNSKYLQSHVEYSYRQAKEKLEEGKFVLFTGTPCQIAGLYAYLGQDYENLVTVDLVCHGVPSDKVFRKYIKDHEKKTGKQVESFSRDKEYGWKPVQFTYAYTDGTTVSYTGRKDKFNMGFTTNLFQRPSCYTCPFALMERIGDITAGDWFGGNKYKELDPENRGLSMIVLNSPKGEAVYENIRDRMFSKEYSVEEAVKESVHLGNPPRMNYMRRAFFKKVDKMTYDELYTRFFPKRIVGRVKNAIIRRWNKKFTKNMFK